MSETIRLETDVLVVGGGGAGMYAAHAAAAHGASVVLVDKNVIGRGGATIMAQMTCAAALGESEADGPELHLADTVEAGRGLCNERLSALLCEGMPDRVRELASWKVNWARDEQGRINQVKAPGHSRKRCVYVDYLCTGAAISAALRNKTSRDTAIRRLSNVGITDIVTREGAAVGAVGIDTATSAPVVIAARAVVLALGGLTKLYSRTTASNNMAGEGLGLALRAGARLVDVEFVQFYPNGHLAPRMVGLDPTTWEPTRVKLGGRLLNSEGREFLADYDGEASGSGYGTTRDTLTYAICKEVEQGRGSPHGGVFLSFRHIGEERLKAALGPMIGIFDRNDIHLMRQDVEVFPIAHYQMGGVEVDSDMATCVPGLLAAGELVGGANGANRLSGNALPEAMVFGHRAGITAAEFARRQGRSELGRESAAAGIDLIRSLPGRNEKDGPATTQLLAELKDLMWRKVGVFRNGADLSAALDAIRRMRLERIDRAAIPRQSVHNAALVEWLELRNGLMAAEAVALAALHRQESRGAHQRTDHAEPRQEFRRSQYVSLSGDDLVSSFQPSGAGA